MKAVLSACALLVGISALGQTISYFNQGFLRQPNAAMDRAYLGVTNAVPANWGFMTCYGPGTHLSSPLAAFNTYYTITNYTASFTNGFYGNVTTGYLTNVAAGWYRISFSVSATPGNGDQIEVDVASNSVPSDVIAAHASAYNPAKDVCAAGSGTMYLPAGTAISLKLKNLNTTTLTAVTHVQLNVGSP